MVPTWSRSDGDCSADSLSRSGGCHVSRPGSGGGGGGADSPVRRHHSFGVAGNPSRHEAVRSRCAKPDQAWKFGRPCLNPKWSWRMVTRSICISGYRWCRGETGLPLFPATSGSNSIIGQIKVALHRKAFEKEAYRFHLDDKLPSGCEDCHDLREITNIDPMGLMKGQGSCIVCHKNFIERIKLRHSPTVNNQCLICHQLSLKPWRIGIPAGKIDDTCFICHTGKKELMSQKHRHGPLVAGCILCHNPHGDEYRYYLWADGSVDICVTCHSDMKKLLEPDSPSFNVHGVIRGPGCVVCHDPHASDEQFMLRKPVNMLCLGCHQDNIDSENRASGCRAPKCRSD